MMIDRHSPPVFLCTGGVRYSSHATIRMMFFFC